MSTEKNPPGYTAAERNSKAEKKLAETREIQSPPSAEMRHTVRTPLNHIIGYSELLLEEAEERDLESFASDLRKIHAAGKRLKVLIDDLFDPATKGKGDGVTPASKSPISTHLLQENEANRVSLPGDRERGFETAMGHLFVVDDNEDNRDMLSRRLINQGYSVSTAANGLEALKLLTMQPVDLILLDVMMPEMDGYDVLKALKANSDWRDIPVIMVSALGEIESVVRCIEQGAEDYLTKPFDPVLLRARIGACLEKKRLRDQEVLYLKDVAQVTDAAGAVENGSFSAASLADVAARNDELGRLARVFQRMAREVEAREQRLQLQIEELRIEIDEAKKTREVAEITDTDYFHQLQEKARKLRSRSR